MLSYYTKLKALWDELNDLDPLTGCSCAAKQEHQRSEEEERIYQFLMGLDSGLYDSVKSQILNAEPMVNL